MSKESQVEYPGASSLCLQAKEARLLEFAQLSRATPSYQGQIAILFFLCTLITSGKVYSTQSGSLSPSCCREASLRTKDALVSVRAPEEQVANHGDDRCGGALTNVTHAHPRLHQDVEVFPHDRRHCGYVSPQTRYQYSCPTAYLKR